MLYTNEEFNADLVNDLYTEYINSTEYQEYLSCYKSYKGKYAILDVTKPKWQPNNKLVNNFAKNITDTFAGFVGSNGISVTGLNDELTEFNNRNNINTKNMEALRAAIKFGVAYELLYQNELGETKNIILDPVNSFMVYDMSIETKPLFFVRWNVDDEENINGEVYTRDKIYEFDGSNTIGELKTKGDNVYGGQVPVAIWKLNEEQRSVFIDQLSLIEAYNTVFSNKINDIQAFSDAYLVLKDVDINAKDDTYEAQQEAVNNFINTIRNSHVMVMNSKETYEGQANQSSAEFITKPSDDASQEHALDRLEKQIYSLSSVVNFNNESFGNSSGIALQLRLQPMRDLMGSFVQLCVNTLNKRYELVCSVATIKNKEAWRDLDYIFVENTPKDIKNEAEALAILETTVSKETALSQTSFISNVDEEMERLKEQNKVENELY